MKRLFFLFILLPFASFSQCPQWLGGSLDSALALEKVAEKYLEFPLNRAGDTTSKERYDYEDSKGFCSFTFTLKKQNTLEGAEVKTTYGPVDLLYIKGPAERIEKLFTEYFYPLIKPCETKASPTWIMWNGYMLVHHNDREQQGIKLAFIEIRKQQ